VISRIKFIVADKNALEKEKTWKAPTVKINGKNEVISLDIDDNKKIFVYESYEGCDSSGVVEINQSVLERATEQIWFNFNKIEKSLIRILCKKSSFNTVDRIFKIKMRERIKAEQYGTENMYLFSDYIDTALLIDRGSLSKIRSDSSGNACLVDKTEKNIVDVKWNFNKNDRATKRVIVKINNINSRYNGMQLPAYLYMKKHGEEYIRGKELHHKYDCMDNRLESAVMLTEEEHKKEGGYRHAYQYKIETFTELLCFLIFVNSPEYRRLYS